MSDFKELIKKFDNFMLSDGFVSGKGFATYLEQYVKEQKKLGGEGLTYDKIYELIIEYRDLKKERKNDE